MITCKKTLTFLSASLIISSFTFASNSEASKLTLVNQSTQELVTYVYAEPFRESQPSCFKCLNNRFNVGENTRQIIILPEHINGATKFAVVGSEGGAFCNGDCRNLETDKNYKLTFSETINGTTCVSEEI